MESILYNIKEQVTKKENEEYHQFMGKVQYEESQESPTINL